jgi:hypothetical protein
MIIIIALITVECRPHTTCPPPTATPPPTNHYPPHHRHLHRLPRSHLQSHRTTQLRPQPPPPPTRQSAAAADVPMHPLRHLHPAPLDPCALEPPAHEPLLLGTSFLVVQPAPQSAQHPRHRHTPCNIGHFRGRQETLVTQIWPPTGLGRRISTGGQGGGERGGARGGRDCQRRRRKSSQLNLYVQSYLLT